MSHLHLMFNMSILYQPQSHIKPSKFIGNPPVKLQNFANNDTSIPGKKNRRVSSVAAAPGCARWTTSPAATIRLEASAQFHKNLWFFLDGQKGGDGKNEKMLDNIQKSLISLIKKRPRISGCCMFPYLSTLHIKPWCNENCVVSCLDEATTNKWDQWRPPMARCTHWRRVSGMSPGSKRPRPKHLFATQRTKGETTRQQLSFIWRGLGFSHKSKNNCNNNIRIACGWRSTSFCPLMSSIHFSNPISTSFTIPWFQSCAEAETL